MAIADFTERRNVARGLLDYGLLQYQPRDELSADERELFYQLILLEEKLEAEREFLRMLPGRLNNPELLEGCRRYAGILGEKLRVLDELAQVPLDVDPFMHVLGRFCWEVNACVVVAANRH